MHSFFFWLARLAKPTDKVTCSHQEREFQSSKQIGSASGTPDKTTRVLELIHPTEPSICHPISSLRVCINQTARRRLSLYSSGSVMMDGVGWHFRMHTKGLVVFSHSYQTEFHGTRDSFLDSADPKGSVLERITAALLREVT